MPCGRRSRRRRLRMPMPTTPATTQPWPINGRLVRSWSKGSRVAGREAIVASIRGWLEQHPEARIRIDIADVHLRRRQSLARVRGRIRFSRQPGTPPQDSPFTCLRMLDNGVWRPGRVDGGPESGGGAR